MSTPPPKNDPALAMWEHAEKLLDEEDDDDARVAKLTPDELRAELDAQGVPLPTRPWSLDEALASVGDRAGKASASSARPPVAPVATPASQEPSAPKLAPVVPVRRNLWRNVPLALAASFALFIGVEAAQGPGTAGQGPPEDVLAARKSRERAIAACAAKDWAQCEVWLDDAAQRDPDGEDAPEVRRARDAIAAGTAGIDAGER